MGAFGKGHYTAIPGYGFANVQVRRILLARADESAPERFVVDAAEVWKSSSKLVQIETERAARKPPAGVWPPIASQNADWEAHGKRQGFALLTQGELP